MFFLQPLFLHFRDCKEEYLLGEKRAYPCVAAVYAYLPLSSGFLWGKLLILLTGQGSEKHKYNNFYSGEKMTEWTVLCFINPLCENTEKHSWYLEKG